LEPPAHDNHDRLDAELTIIGLNKQLLLISVKSLPSTVTAGIYAMGGTSALDPNHFTE
jgi:hypothetical protein